MKVKKYIAPTMAEALSKIKQELGSDAVILNSKQIKAGGIFGLFKKTNVEVIAALDENPLPFNQKTQPEVALTKTQEASRINHSVYVDQYEVLQEIKQLRDLVTSQSRPIRNPFTAPFDTVFMFLIEQEVFPSVAEEIVTEMENQAEPQEINEAFIMSYVSQFMQTVLKPRIKDVTISHKKVIQFVGPTGVGKTTTIAKVAAKMMLEQKKTVAFITTDTYRIAAIEQLKTYAKILDVPVEVAYSNAEYEHALEKFATYDHVFVDTAGRNYRETANVVDLGKMIEFNSENRETYIVLSLTAKAKDNVEIFQVFNEKGVEQVIFTKVDETTTYGSLINLCLGEGAKIAYISNGQNVPDDMVKAEAAYISHLLMSEYVDE